jgi:hypothetical protein
LEISPSKKKDPFDMSADSHSIMLLDKESTKIQERWKPIVVYKGGQIRKITDCIVNGVQREEAEAGKDVWAVKHKLVEFLKDGEEKVLSSLPGSIVKVFNPPTVFNSSPLFMV